jgi:hypothetical protein
MIMFIILSVEAVKRSEMRRRRDQRGRRANMVRKLMTGPREKDGNLRLVEGSNQYEGIYTTFIFL